MNIIGLQGVSVVELVHALRSGQTIVYPTETCYGLGCDATNDTAIEKVFSMKGREKQKTVLMLASSVDMVKKYAEWSDSADRLARTYWPGPVTMVLPLRSSSHVPQLLVGGGQTVAFRVSSHPLVQKVVQALGVPLVSTSANLSGMPHQYDVPSVIRMFEERSVQPDIVIDAGILPERPPSTIIAVSEQDVCVLRQGDIFVKI